jgi:hypothetical protein
MQQRVVLGVVMLISASAACAPGGDDVEPGGGNDATSGGGGAGASAPITDVVVEPSAVSLDVPLDGTAQQAFTATANVGGQVQDVTDLCAWSVDSAFGGMQGSTLSAAPRGGTTAVTATCDGATGSASVELRLIGDVLGPGAPADAKTLFTGATPTVDPTRTPALEYPIDGAVGPRNLPSIEAQYTTAGNDLFRVHLTSAFVDVSLYTTAAEALLSAEHWLAVTNSAVSSDLTFRVEGLLQSAPTTKFESAPANVRVSADVIDKSAIYWWASSTGQLITQTFGETGAPTPIKGDCTSCHSLSRSGSRIGYSRCLNNDCGTIRIGFMRFDKTTEQWLDSYDANQSNITGSYSTFSPVGNPFPDDGQSLAAVTLSTGALELYDPDSGQPVPSNLAQAATNGGTRSALMPDWSPDGAHVAFASSPTVSQWIDLDGSAIARVPYSYDGVSHTFGALELLVQGPIERPAGTFTNFYFPSYSPDGSLLVFNGARAPWRNFQNAKSPGQRLFLASADGAWNLELEAMNGAGDLDITWPHWAPGQTSEYYWVVFASQRDYGHRVTAANSNPACVANGVFQCKQLWIGAIARDQVQGAPSGDPSAPPVWLPGQDLGANNISPYWTIPTNAIPE